MPRIRAIKPEFWSDEVIAALSPLARLLFIGSWNLADDEGRLRWTPDYINASLFMYDRLTTTKVRSLMAELEAHGLVIAYTGGKSHQSLAYVPNFLRHQRISKPQPSKLPPPPQTTSLFDELLPSERGSRNGSATHSATHSATDTPDDSTPTSATDPPTDTENDSATIPRPVAPGREGKGREGNREGTARSRNDLAKAIVSHWWESHDPRPPNDFLGVTKVVARLLASGADPRALRRALDDAPVPTLNALQVAMSRPSTSATARIITERDGPTVLSIPEDWPT